MRRYLRIFIVFMTAGLQLLGPVAARAQGSQADEYQVKAAFLYHFAKFVEWPAEAAANAGQVLHISVLGRSPFGDALESIDGKKVRNRQVVVTYLDRVEDLKDCDILFVCSSEKSRLGQVLGSVASRQILTVSDIRRFASSGGMIGFVTVNDKVKFEINQRVAQRSRLRLSAQLLKLATTILE